MLSELFNEKGGFMISQEECPNCDGTGKMHDGKDCPKCNGTGFVYIETPNKKKD